MDVWDKIRGKGNTTAIVEAAKATGGTVLVPTSREATRLSRMGVKAEVYYRSASGRDDGPYFVDAHLPQMLSMENEKLRARVHVLERETADLSAAYAEAVMSAGAVRAGEVTVLLTPDKHFDKDAFHTAGLALGVDASEDEITLTVIKNRHATPVRLIGGDQ